MKNSMNLTRDSLKNWPVFTALVTPFKGGEIDFNALDRLIENQKKQRCGLVVLGSTGEAFSLTDAERKEILSFVLERQGDVPLIVGASSGSFQGVMETISFLNTLSIQGILLSLPPYYKPGPQGQKEFFEKALNASQHPVVLYNHPGRVGVAIDPFVIESLKHHPNLLMLKYSSPEREPLRAIQKVAPEVPIFLGDDSLLHAFRHEKLMGLISVMANAWPEETKKYTGLCLLNDTAPELDIFDGLEQATNPIPIKAVLSKLMNFNFDVRLPLSVKDLQHPEKIEVSIEKMHNWRLELDK